MTTEAGLVNLRDGRAALERARNLGEIREIKRIGDLAAAAKRFAEAQGLSEEAKRYAAEMELDAKRYLGEVLAKQPKQSGGRPAKTSAATAEVLPPPSIPELGITHRQSSEAQKIAAIPDEDYQYFKAEARVDELNTSQALQLEREINKANIAPIIDASERDLRLRRVRALRLNAVVHAAVAELHNRLDEVADAVQHDDAQRHTTDLHESARLLSLVAARVGETQLRRVK